MPMTLAQRAVAACVGVWGASLMIGANYAPNLPLIDRSAPAVFVVLGLLGVVAAVGIIRRESWGRLLGVLFAILVVVLALGPIAGSLIRDGALDASDVVMWGVYVAVIGFILFELLRRWPFPVHPAFSAR